MGDVGDVYLQFEVTHGQLADQDGIVELRELDPYVKAQVKKLTQDRQHPVTSVPANFEPPPLTILADKAAGRGGRGAVAGLTP